MNRCFLIISLLFSNIVFAQQPVSVKYYNNDKLEIAKPDGAAYSRHYFKDTIDFVASRYIIKEFYSSGKQKMLGTSFFKDNREYYDGQFNYYDKAGTLREITNFKDGYKLGKSYRFYPNRKLMKELMYVYNTQHDVSLRILEGHGLYHESVFARGKLIEYVDSLGNSLVKNGSGYIKLPTNYFGEDFVEEGGYVDGLKEGEWKITTQQGETTFLEKYSKGDLVSGISFIGDKKEKYRHVFIRPRIGKLNFITSYLKEATVSGSGKYFQDSYFAYPDNSILKTDSCVKLKADFNLVIDKNGRLIDVEFVTVLPKTISERLKKEFLRNGGYSAGRYRNEPKQMKLPYSITIYYDKNL